MTLKAEMLKQRTRITIHIYFPGVFASNCPAMYAKQTRNVSSHMEQVLVLGTWMQVLQTTYK